MTVPAVGRVIGRVFRSPMPVTSRWILVPAFIASCGGIAAPSRDEVPAELRAFFAPPAGVGAPAAELRSPLILDDGSAVRTAEDWRRRRGEILRHWHERMGPWPRLLERPRLEFFEKRDRGDVTEHRVEIEVAPGVMQHGFLLLDRKSTRLNSSHVSESRMPSSA